MAKPAKAKAAPVDVAALSQPQEVAAPAPADTFEMLSPEGSIENVRSSQAGTLAALGYKPLTPEMRQSMADQSKYGGTLGELGAGALGFARGASLGLSDYAIKKAEGAGILSSGTTEDVRKLQEFNPDASLVGELASFAVPAAGAIKALGTAGKVAKAAGAAQTGIGLAGDALGAAAGKIAGETFGKYAAPAVKLAAESAIFQAGHNISEESLQNRDLTVESVLAHTGEAAILGAGMGAGLPLAMRAAKAGVAAAVDSKPMQWLLDGTQEQFAKFFDPERSTQLFSGAMKKELNADTGQKFQESVASLRKKGLYGAGEIETNLENAAFNQKAAGRLPDQEALFDRIVDAQEKLTAKRAEVFADIDAAIAAPKFSLGGTDQWAALGGQSAKAQKRFQKEFVAEVTDFAPSAKAELTKLGERLRKTGAIDDVAGVEEMVEKYRGLMQETGGSLAQLQALKEGIYNTVKEANYAAAKMGSKAPPSMQVLKQIGRYVKENIEFGVERIKNEQAYRGIANKVAAIGDINQTLSELATVRKPLASKIAGNEQNVNVLGGRFRDMLTSIGGAFAGNAVGGPVGGAIGLASGAVNKILQTDRGLLMRASMGEKLATLGWLKKTTDATQTNIAKSMASFVHDIDTDRIARSVVKATAELAADVSNVARRRIEPPKPMAPSSPLQRVASQQEWFDGVSKQLQAIAADPSGFAAKQGAQIGALKANAPETTDAIVAKQMAAYAYLLEAMPKNPTAPMNVMASQWRPADYDIARFRDVVRTVQNPMTVMQDLKSGTLTRAQTKAVQTLYPAIYQQMADQARETVSKPGVNLPYEKRLRLGTLFPGVEASLRPGFIVAMASAPPTKDEQEKMGGYRPGAAAQMKSGSSFQTKTNNLSTR